VSSRGTPSSEEKKLVQSIQHLEKSMSRLPKQFAYVLDPGKNFFIAYLRGIFYGLGALTAFAILIPVIVWLLQWIEWIPLLGEFVSAVIVRVQQLQGLR